MGRGPHARMMHAGPWAAHSMMNEGRPGLPPQLLRRIRQLVKSMEENKAAEMRQEEEAAEEGGKVPQSKKQQLRRLLHMLERANGMKGPVATQMPPWVVAQMTGAAGGRPSVHCCFSLPCRFWEAMFTLCNTRLRELCIDIFVKKCIIKTCILLYFKYMVVLVISFSSSLKPSYWNGANRSLLFK